MYNNVHIGTYSSQLAFIYTSRQQYVEVSSVKISHTSSISYHNIITSILYALCSYKKKYCLVLLYYSTSTPSSSTTCGSAKFEVQWQQKYIVQYYVYTHQYTLHISWCSTQQYERTIYYSSSICNMQSTSHHVLIKFKKGYYYYTLYIYTVQ